MPGSFRAFLTDRHGSTADTLLDQRQPAPSYRDVLARYERYRPCGAPVWPLRFPSRDLAA
jgi:hypothetical protein